MTEQDVRDFFAALGESRFDEILDRLTDDVVLEFPGKRFGGRFEGKRRVRVFLRQNQRLFRDGLRFTVHWAAVAGDRAVAQWTNQGVTNNGTDYANRGVTVFVLAGDRIAELHDYMDTETLSDTWS